MTRLKQGVILGAIVGAVAFGCVSHRPRGSTPILETPARRFEIRTDSTRYTAERTADEIRMTIEITYLNHGSGPVYVTGCRGPRYPAFYRRVGDRWEGAYGPAHADCEGRRVVIPPGQTYDLVWRLRAPSVTARVNPKFPEPVAGTYRLRFSEIYDTLDRRGDTLPHLRVPVPDSLLYSNEFEIVEKR